MTNEDIVLLSVWAGPHIQSPSHGYVAVSDTYRLSLNRSKKRIHLALDRSGFTPHSGAGLIKAWKSCKRRNLGADIV